MANAAKRKTSTGMSSRRTPPQRLDPVPGGTGMASCAISCERTKPKTKAPLAKRGENRRDIGIGDEEAVDEADQRGRQPRASASAGRSGSSGVQELQIPGNGHRHDRHRRQIDPAADDDDRHADGKDAEHADTERTMATRLSGVRKPLRLKEATRNRIAASKNTMRSWLNQSVRNLTTIPNLRTNDWQPQDGWVRCRWLQTRRARNSIKLQV